MGPPPRDPEMPQVAELGPRRGLAGAPTVPSFREKSAECITFGPSWGLPPGHVKQTCLYPLQTTGKMRKESERHREGKEGRELKKTEGRGRERKFYPRRGVK